MRRIIHMRTFPILVFLLFISLVMSSLAPAAPPFQEVKLTADDLADGAEFGRSVAIGGDLVAVGAGAADANVEGDAAGAVYLYKRQGQTYLPEAKLVAPDATTGAEFGRAVAIQGNLVIVGARFAQVGILSKAGAAYVFRKYKGSWHFEDKIASPTPANDDNFARALAIQGDLLVVTARKENLGANDVGAAYVYLYNDGEWNYQEKLTAGDPAPEAYFGQSVALQGDLIAIGARNADPNGAGAVYLFRRSNDEWEEIAKVSPPDGKSDDQYAFTIAMIGNVMAVGARRADLPADTPGSSDKKDAGAAYVYALDGDSVELVTKLTADDAKGGDQFGQSIAMAGDAVVIGANRAEIGANSRQGAVYLFRHMGNEWIQTRKLTASDGSVDDEFGYSLSAFGNRMVTGAHFAKPTGGVAYVIPLQP